MSDPLAARARATIGRGSKSFALASALFAPGTRESAWLLYAWCRYCDDAIDGQVAGHGHAPLSVEEQRARLEALSACTHAALDGRVPQEPVFPGLQRVVRQHAIPHRLPLDLLDGFAMDVRRRHYETFDDTLEYCYHVAGVVGVMMAHVMGVHDDDTLDRACDLGIAFQLTNIARDLVDDARVGRVYVPCEWMDEAGLSSPRDLAAAGACEPRAGLARRLVHAAEPYYVSAAIGVRRLPWRSAWAVSTALRIYREIGHTAIARGAHAWDARIVVSRARKIRHLAGALGAALGGVVRAKTASPSRGALWTRPVSRSRITRVAAPGTRARSMA